MEDNKTNIIIVQKDETLLDLIKLFLEKIDFLKVEYESEPDSASKKILNNSYDIIIVDQKLCLSNEINLEEVINSPEPLPIIIYLSDSFPEDYDKFNQLSKIVDHICKDEISTPYFLRTIYYASAIARFHKGNAVLLKEFQEKLDGEKGLVLKKTRHDLNNILTMIVGNLELLLFGKYEHSEQVKAKLEVMYNASVEMIEKLKGLK